LTCPNTTQIIVKKNMGIRFRKKIAKLKEKKIKKEKKKEKSGASLYMNNRNICGFEGENNLRVVIYL
jgi:hypothetical protein